MGNRLCGRSQELENLEKKVKNLERDLERKSEELEIERKYFEEKIQSEPPDDLFRLKNVTHTSSVVKTTYSKVTDINGIGPVLAKNLEEKEIGMDELIAEFLKRHRNQDTFILWLQSQGAQKKWAKQAAEHIAKIVPQEWSMVEDFLDPFN